VLESSVGVLQDQLLEQGKEAEVAISSWQGKYCELEQQCSELESQLSTSETKLARSDSSLRNLEAQFAGHAMRSGGMQAIAEARDELESSLAEHKTENAGLREEIASERESRRVERERLEAELADERGRHAEARDEIEELTSSMKRIRNDSGGMQAIAEARDELESSLAEHKTENAGLREEIASERESRRVERERLEAAFADERGRHAEARDEIEELTRSMERIRNDSEDVLNQWTGMYYTEKAAEFDFKL
jgi:chromosome segregation ATPase